MSWQNVHQAFLIQKLQTSNKKCLPLREEPTEVVQEGDWKLLKLHPAEALTMNLRAYVTNILPMLKCLMDFQTTNGKSMILWYVTSSVAKWKDAYASDILYSIHTSPFEAAYCHMQEYTPCEPQMWLQLSSFKVAWSTSRTKRYVLLRHDTYGQHGSSQVPSTTCQHGTTLFASMALRGE